MIEVQWWRSEYDGQVHGFPQEEVQHDFVEALCEHSAPNSKITMTHDGAKCVACLLIFGDMLSEVHGDLSWRAS